MDVNVAQHKMIINVVSDSILHPGFKKLRLVKF